MTEIRYVDSHAHLIGREHENERYIKPRLERAANLGVAVITIAQVPRLWDPTLSLISAHDNIFAVLGVSYSEAAKLEVFERLVRLCKDEPGVVGIGEIGLDYRQGKPPDLQKRKDQLREHIHVAREVNLPLVIHDGKATDDIIAILEEESASDVGGMIHFFTGSSKQALRAIELGFSISFGGPHTYAKPLVDLVKEVPLENTLVETDSPMLAPPRARRKEPNEPSFIVEVVKGIAEIRGMDPEKLREITTNNAIRLFRLDED
ncbi:TatD family hydrolase [bacterium]|nr:TatD family hydrolase [bacterium]